MHVCFSLDSLLQDGKVDDIDKKHRYAAEKKHRADPYQLKNTIAGISSLPSNMNQLQLLTKEFSTSFMEQVYHFCNSKT